MPSIGLDAKLAFVEFLLTSDDISECAHQGLHWLREHAGVSRALCAAATGDADHLWGVAGIGISAARAGEFVVDLTSRDPLAAVVQDGRAVTFSPGGPRPAPPFGNRAPLHAIPMRNNPRQAPIGLLLVEHPQPRVDRDLLWFARVVGDKIRRLSVRPAPDRGLDRERRLLFSIINAVSDPILLTDAQGKLIIGNTRAEQLLAAASESEGHRHALELNNLFFSSALASTTLGRPETGAREVVLVDPEDGSDLLFELITTPIETEGSESAFVSVLRNVTDLGRAAMELEENYRRIRSAEAQVRAERNRIELVIDSVADPIIVSHPSGGILMTNKPADVLFTPLGSDGQAQRRVAGNVAQFSSFTSSVLMSGRPDRIRGRLTLTDPASGRPVPVEAIAAVVPGESDLVAVVSVLHDLTETLDRERLLAELKRATDELERRVREATAELAQQNQLLRSQAVALEHASAAKSRFLASISHEFRTPLNAILGYTWMLLQDGGGVDAGARRMIGKIDSNSRHLAALISDVLDISRIEADQMPLQIVRFDLSALVREVVEDLETLVSRSPVPVVAACDDRIDPLETDRQKLKQILVNLLTNAVKFTREGQIRIQAGLEGTGRCWIAVIDTGPGIPPHEQQRIFEAFEQGSGARRLSTGTGLGLAIARRLATLLGGDLTLESDVGTGSTFAVVIPCCLSAGPDPGVSVAAAEPARARVGASG